MKQRFWITKYAIYDKGIFCVEATAHVSPTGHRRFVYGALPGTQGHTFYADVGKEAFLSKREALEATQLLFQRKLSAMDLQKQKLQIRLNEIEAELGEYTIDDTGVDRDK